MARSEMQNAGGDGRSVPWTLIWTAVAVSAAAVAIAPMLKRGRRTGRLPNGDPQLGGPFGMLHQPAPEAGDAVDPETRVLQ
jgi:hypothetical protein